MEIAFVKLKVMKRVLIRKQHRNIYDKVCSGYCSVEYSESDIAFPDPFDLDAGNPDQVQVSMDYSFVMQNKWRQEKEYSFSL